MATLFGVLSVLACAVGAFYAGYWHGRREEGNTWLRVIGWTDMPQEHRYRVLDAYRREMP